MQHFDSFAYGVLTLVLFGILVMALLAIFVYAYRKKPLVPRQKQSMQSSQLFSLFRH